MASSAFDKACKLTAFSASKDATRLSMNAPFGCKLAGLLWVAATDGHRIFAVRCDDQKIPGVSDPPRPPLERAIPKEPELVGTVSATETLLAQLKVPRGWRINLAISSIDCAATVHRMMPDDYPDVPVFRNVPHLAVIALDLPEPVGINSAYLHEALVALDSPRVFAWRNRSTPLDPWVFTPGEKRWQESDRFAVVMPVRL